MGADEFESPESLIYGAGEDTTDFQSRYDAFVKSCRCVPVHEIDPQTRENIYKLRITNKIPGRLRYVANNIINNLRHSLDQALNAAAFELGYTKRDSYFPYGKDLDGLNEQIKKQCPRIPDELKEYIRDCKPYIGGNDLLWAICSLPGPRKHRISFNLNVNPPDFELFPLTFTGPGQIGFIGWDSDKQELHYARGGHIEFHGEPHLSVYIEISTSPVLSGQPAAGLLHECLGVVSGVVSGLKAQAALTKSG